MSPYFRTTAVSALAAFVHVSLSAQATTVRDSVAPIKPPSVPLPAEQATASVTRFSFIAYGDTRGRHDGTELQAEHTLVMEEMLTAIKRSAGGPGRRLSNASRAEKSFASRRWPGPGNEDRYRAAIGARHCRIPRL